MEGRVLANLLRSLRAGGVSGPDDEVPDTELLRRFRALQDEVAFELLVRRHAALVFGVCRRLLHDVHDAEDAFQATFLVLVRKAGAIRLGTSLGSWLYKVAFRVASRARDRGRRRGELVKSVAELPETAAHDPSPHSDLSAVLDEEVQRLPRTYRLVVTLCYLAGKTTEEAARELGCPRGTVLSRLATARQRLRDRLVRRGVAPTVAAGFVAAESLAATIRAPYALVHATTRTALLSRSGTGIPISPQVSVLVEGVLHTMFLSKVKIAAALALVLALGGVGVWAQRPGSSQSETARPESVDRSARPAVDAKQEPAAPDRDTRRWQGVWERPVEGFILSLRFEANRLHATLAQPTEGDGPPPAVTLKGDYNSVRENQIAGVITSIEFSGDFSLADDRKFIEGWKGILEGGLILLNQPFSMRLDADETTLTVRDFNLGLRLVMAREGKEEEFTKMLRLVLGAFRKRTAADGERPLPPVPPKRAKPSSSGS